MNAAEIPYIFYCEETPNPASLKFVANRLLVVSGASADYENISQTDGAPVANKLFQFPFVKRVFISSNYISITRHDFVEWEEIRDELRTFLTSWLNQGNPVIIEALLKKLMPEQVKEVVSEAL
jgi:hypothetical protein